MKIILGRKKTFFLSEMTNERLFFVVVIFRLKTFKSFLDRQEIQNDRKRDEQEGRGTEWPIRGMATPLS